MTKHGLLGVLALVAVACDDDSEGFFEPLQPSIAVVYGHVMTADGVAVGDALVTVRGTALSFGGCKPIPEENFGLSFGRTDGAGFYRHVGQFLGFAREDVCLVVTVTPLSGSGLLPKTVSGEIVTFILKSHTPPVDSVRVDIELD